MKWLTGIVIALLIIVAGWYWLSSMNSSPSTPSTTATSTAMQTYGMTEYSDATYGFTFWYPSAVTVSASTTDDTNAFPGGTEVERLQVGEAGGTYVAVVTSPEGTITDEPNGHASPIAQTKYFYDNGQWMIAYPEGSPTGNSATTTADISVSTAGGLVLLPAGARFDTHIVPLSPTTFLVIGDGGGSFYTSQLAKTVAATNAPADQTILSAALQDEANAYASGQ